MIDTTIGPGPDFFRLERRRLREFRDEGVLGSLAPDYYRLKENYSQRKTNEVDAPEVLRLCQQAQVDVALMSPV